MLFLGFKVSASTCFFEFSGRKIATLAKLLMEAKIVTLDRFARALRLPTFEIESMTLIKRLTLIIFDGRVEKVFYPVFPPDKNAAEVIEWFLRNPMRGRGRRKINGDRPLK